MKVVAITGGTGLIGNYLVKSLIDNNYEVRILSRNKNLISKKGFYYWNPLTKEIDGSVFSNLDGIINLAGSNISAKLWTNNRKKEILESRTSALNLLYEKCKLFNFQPKVLISASAVGYYGIAPSNVIFVESDKPGDDYLAKVCQKWEESADLFETLGSRVVKIRISAVLAKEGGVIKKLYPVFNYGLGSALGNGKQIFPFVHIKDLINIINFTLENEKMSGAFNAVSPEIITNYDFSILLSKALKKKMILPNVPPWILKLVLGELSDILLNGNAISSQKLINAGFKFKYEKLNEALENIFDN